jgi:nucleotide-binding universal stress UspA family protein
MMEQKLQSKQDGFETVLLAVGDAGTMDVDQLVTEAVDAAKPSDATVVLLHVFTEDEYDEARVNLKIDANSEMQSPDAVARHHTPTRELANRLDESGVEYEIRGAVGSRGEEIVDFADESGADRVLISGRSRSPTRKAMFGSTAQKVLLSSPCPVTFVRADTA